MQMLNVIMEIELLKYIVIGIPVIFIAMLFYVFLLLYIARVFGGVAKYVLGISLYLVFGVTLFFPLLLMCTQFQPAVYEPAYNQFVVLFSYVLIIAPAIYFLGKVKMKELQSAGYFLHRK